MRQCFVWVGGERGFQGEGVGEDLSLGGGGEIGQASRGATGETMNGN